MQESRSNEDPSARRLQTSADLGEANRGRIIAIIRDEGPLSRTELAQRMGATRAGVSNLVQQLIAQRILREGVPRTTGARGKPSRPLAFADSAACALAVTIHDNGEIVAGAMSASGDVIELLKTRLEGSTDSPAERVIDSVVSLITILSERNPGVLGLGVGIPGVADRHGTIISSVRLPQMEGVALGELLAERTGLDTDVRNTAQFEALADAWFGQGRGVPTFASVHTGVGLAATVVRGGRAWQGEAGNVAEIGHVLVDTGGRQCVCGLQGCWETVANLEWLRREAKRLGIPGHAHITAQSLSALSDRGSEPATRVLAAYAEALASGLAILMQVVGPKLLIIHGDAARGGERFLTDVESFTRARVLRTLQDSVRVVASGLGEEAPMLGVLSTVLSARFAVGEG